MTADWRALLSGEGVDRDKKVREKERSFVLAYHLIQMQSNVGCGECNCQSSEPLSQI